MALDINFMKQESNKIIKLFSFRIRCIGPMRTLIFIGCGLVYIPSMAFLVLASDQKSNNMQVSIS
jgi:hypothetical protein